MRALNRYLFISASLVLLILGVAVADQTNFKSSAANNLQNADCSTRAGSFEPFTLAWLVDGNPSVENGEQMISCSTQVSDGANGRKGVKVRLEVELLDLNGNTISSLGTKTGKSDKNGNERLDFDVSGRVPDGQSYLVSVDGTYSTKKKIDTAETVCTAVDREPCTDDKETLCLLNDERFKVEVEWTASGNSGAGQVISSGLDTGTFYFLNPNSDDLVVQLLNACSTNDHFWVFYAATTNVEYDLTVTDTSTGASRTYGNDLPFQAVTDTSAFSTCP